MGNWFKARWRAYLESSDPDEALAGSGPAAIAVAAGTLVTVFLLLAYVRPLADLSKFERPGYPIALVALGACLTFISYKYKCRGPIGSVTTLLDNTFYSSAIALAAMSTTANVGIALAVVHGMAMASTTSQLYAFSLVLALVMSAPLLALLALMQPELPVALILIASIVLMLFVSEVTRSRREAKRRQVQLEQALRAADRLADESVQAALTTTLLSLGHFLHELRNCQTAISLSLEYIAAKAELSEAVASALQEAQSAQTRQEVLLNDVVNDLRGRSRPVEASFSLSQVVRNSVVETQGVDVVINKSDVEFEIAGNPEHLRIVLLNLLRNAEQAGARTVSLVWRPDQFGQIVHMIVHDDGKGIPEPNRARLFDSFALSDKPGGTGLGLYLVRRYIEVLGGQVRIEAGPLGGAAFVIRLPVFRGEKSVTETR